SSGVSPAAAAGGLANGFRGSCAIGTRTGRPARDVPPSAGAGTLLPRTPPDRAVRVAAGWAVGPAAVVGPAAGDRVPGRAGAAAAVAGAAFGGCRSRLVRWTSGEVRRPAWDGSRIGRVQPSRFAVSGSAPTDSVRAT